MSESIAAEIHIGGKVRRSVAQALCKVISQSGASLEWGGGSCQIGTPEELLEARSADDDGLQGHARRGHGEAWPQDQARSF